MIRVYIIGLWSILRRCLLSPAAAAACPPLLPARSPARLLALALQGKLCPV